MNLPHNPNYIHHKKGGLSATIRELVFGMEDGMVSTLGAVTGIATATQDPYLVLLAGCIVVSVESISMAVGSYLSSKSEKSIDERKLAEESEELQQFPEEEREELEGMYIEDGWPAALAKDMAAAASKNKKLFLQEMAYRELKVFPDAMQEPIKNGLVMGCSYIAGGLIPLLPYMFLPVLSGLKASIGITLVGLFALGVFVTKFSKRPWLRSGLEMLVLAGLAAGVGYGVGQLLESVLR